MTGILTVSSKLTPFPFGAIAIASYTQKATIVFDESATGVTLDFDGKRTTSEDEIVQTLATAGELTADNANVKYLTINCRDQC